MNLASRLLSLRKAKGISQEELADKVGVSRQAVSKWESAQSIPDLDKVIIMSEYFGVTTDYILKGIKSTPQLENKNFITGQILYIASTAILAIGLLYAFGSWHMEQLAKNIWGAMVIQVVGVVAYFIGRLISQSKPPFMIDWLNVIIALFMPISLFVAFIFNRKMAPYPTDIYVGIIFAMVYSIAIIISYFAIYRGNKYQKIG